MRIGPVGHGIQRKAAAGRRVRAGASAWLAMTWIMTAPAFGHHSFAGFYDQDRIVEIEGVVTSVSWRNPHGSLTIDVIADDGGRVEWQVETGSVSVLRVRGLDREFVQVGDRVRIAGEAALRRERGLYARNMLLASGEEVLLSIGIVPRWTAAGTGELLEARFDEAAAESAQREAEGIFRVWSTVFEDPNSFPMFKGSYPLTSAAERRQSEWDSGDVVQLGCEPKGMPSLMITPYPMQFLTAGDDILIRFEEDDAVRRIHMSPDAPRTEGFGSLLGFSRGRWEGSTLVVETTGVNAEYFDGAGTPQSSAARFVERFTVNGSEDRLDYRIEVTDPVTFTSSFELARYWIWRPELEVNPYDCSIAG